MNNKEYDRIVKKISAKENVSKDFLVSFLVGGFIGLLSELLSNYYTAWFNLSVSDSYLMVFITFIVVGSVLTGLGVFDALLSRCKCGLIVPSTGFANSMTSAAMDVRREGFVKGIGAGIFKLTGAIIVYGIIFGIIFGFIRAVIL